MDEKEIPPYAILSHRWGAGNDEVILRDIIEGTGTRKTGYDKIRACGNQATIDGLALFWVTLAALGMSPRLLRRTTTEAVAAKNNRY
jgi:hypothetical protein